MHGLSGLCHFFCQTIPEDTLNKIGGLFMDTAISTCAFLLLAYEWNSKFLVALAFIIALTGACTNFNINYK